MPSFITRIELLVFCIVVMIVSSVAIYDGRMATIKTTLSSVFDFSIPVKLELMQYYAHTGQWPGSGYLLRVLPVEKSDIIEETAMQPDGVFQFLLSSRYKDIDKKVVRFEPVIVPHLSGYSPMRWQCRLYDKDPMLQNHPPVRAEGDYVPNLCRD